MSQIPSESSRRARLAEQRVDRCHVCKATDVSGTHVDRCEETDRYWKTAAQVIDAAAIPGATGHDLWAHVNTSYGPVMATKVVQLVTDLGWRPVVGSTPARLWTRPTTTPDTSPSDGARKDHR